MEQQEVSIEKEAHTLLSQGQNEQARKLFKKAAIAFSQSGNHRQAALMFASAASVWGKVYSDKSFYAAAQLYEEAAKEAVKYHDFDYATLMYKYAAIDYERDGEYEKFSNCFYNTKDCARKQLFSSLFQGRGGPGYRIKKFITGCALEISCLIWGYGERPLRTFVTGVTMVLGCAFLFMHTGLAQGGTRYNPSFIDALYFSVATITTLGSADIAPYGISRHIALTEAFFGIFIISLYFISLSRKYLRI